MTSTIEQALEQRRQAAVHATRAPSVHNTQPWQIGLRQDGLDLYADRSRQLPVLDPTGRQLMLSLGSALMNIRVSYAGAGTHTHVERFPSGPTSPLVATVRATDAPMTPDDRRLAALAPLIELRYSNRREFALDPVPLEVIDLLVDAAASEDARLFPILTEDHRLSVARLTQQADREENGNPAYRAEMRRWTSNQPSRHDGLTQLVVPRVDGDSADDIPIRDFDTYGMGWLPSHTHSSREQCLLLLGTDSDTDLDWLRAGEALERILLEVTRQGFVSSLFTQPIEVVHVRERLRAELGVTMHPHVLLRIGRAPATPTTSRRPLADVTFDADAESGAAGTETGTGSATERPQA